MPDKPEEEIELSPRLEKLAEEFAKDPTSLKYLPLADEYRKCKMFEEAIYIAKEGLRSHPDHLPGKQVLARCHLDQKDYISAIQLLREIVEHAPDNAASRRMLADIYFETGDLGSAREHYLIVDQLNPGDKYIQGRLEETGLGEVRHRAVSMSQMEELETEVQDAQQEKDQKEITYSGTRYDFIDDNGVENETPGGKPPLSLQLDGGEPDTPDFGESADLELGVETAGEGLGSFELSLEDEEQGETPDLDLSTGEFDGEGEESVSLSIPGDEEEIGGREAAPTDQGESPLDMDLDLPEESASTESQGFDLDEVKETETVGPAGEGQEAALEESELEVLDMDGEVGEEEPIELDANQIVEEERSQTHERLDFMLGPTEAGGGHTTVSRKDTDEETTLRVEPKKALEDAEALETVEVALLSPAEKDELQERDLILTESYIVRKGHVPTEDLSGLTGPTGVIADVSEQEEPSAEEDFAGGFLLDEMPSDDESFADISVEIEGEEAREEVETKPEEGVPLSTEKEREPVPGAPAYEVSDEAEMIFSKGDDYMAGEAEELDGRMDLEPTGLDEPGFSLETDRLSSDSAVDLEFSFEEVTERAEQEEPAPATLTTVKIYESQGHFDKALAICKQLLESNPNNEELLDKIDELEQLAASDLPTEHAPKADSDGLILDVSGATDLEFINQPLDASDADEREFTERQIAMLRGWLADIEAYRKNKESELSG